MEGGEVGILRGDRVRVDLLVMARVVSASGREGAGYGGGYRAGRVE